MSIYCIIYHMDRTQNCTAVISENWRCGKISPFVSPFFVMLLSCLLLRECQFVFLPSQCTHLLFLGSDILNGLILTCNVYISCIIRSTGSFSIMHTVIYFWCGIAHWLGTLFPLCRHEITIFEYISVMLP